MILSVINWVAYSNYVQYFPVCSPGCPTVFNLRHAGTLLYTYCKNKHQWSSLNIAMYSTVASTVREWLFFISSSSVPLKRCSSWRTCNCTTDLCKYSDTGKKVQCNFRCLSGQFRAKIDFDIELCPQMKQIESPWKDKTFYCTSNLLPVWTMDTGWY